MWVWVCVWVSHLSGGPCLVGCWIVDQKGEVGVMPQDCTALWEGNLQMQDQAAELFQAFGLAVHWQLTSSHCRPPAPESRHCFPHTGEGTLWFVFQIRCFASRQLAHQHRRPLASESGHCLLDSEEGKLKGLQNTRGLFFVVVAAAVAAAVAVVAAVVVAVVVAVAVYEPGFKPESAVYDLGFKSESAVSIQGLNLNPRFRLRV